ncbi:MAG: metallophosphoesterase [Clostridiales bacterium]|nr:metallophosphoesterase [Clostridiales bacterium]
MALFTIADLHLSESVNKPMDIFGGAWDNYTEKIKTNFNKTLHDDDIIVIAGDVSWGINLDEALADFQLLSNLPAKKLIVKGNHDLWWNTIAKMKRFLEENCLKNIDFIYNNYFNYENIALCGTRGWFYEEDNGTEHNKKIFRRELLRLEASLNAASLSDAEQIYVFLHYPPLCKNYCCDELLSILKKYKVSKCFYGHLHGGSHKLAKEGIIDGIEFRLVAADAVNFMPVLILP